MGFDRDNDGIVALFEVVSVSASARVVKEYKSLYVFSISEFNLFPRCILLSIIGIKCRTITISFNFSNPSLTPSVRSSSSWKRPGGRRGVDLRIVKPAHSHSLSYPISQNNPSNNNMPTPQLRWPKYQATSVSKSIQSVALFASNPLPHPFHR